MPVSEQFLHLFETLLHNYHEIKQPVDVQYSAIHDSLKKIFLELKMDDSQFTDELLIAALASNAAVIQEAPQFKEDVQKFLAEAYTLKSNPLNFVNSTGEVLRQLPCTKRPEEPKAERVHSGAAHTFFSEQIKQKAEEFAESRRIRESLRLKEKYELSEYNATPRVR